METLLRAINEILEARDKEISMLKWEKECIAKENESLRYDIAKYKANEQIEATNVLGKIEEILR